MGQVWIGILPNEHSNLIGLSKYARICDWIMSRPQIQEEAVTMLANELQARVKPDGLSGFIHTLCDAGLELPSRVLHQMRWSPRGAHLLAQVRYAVINGDLVNRLRRWAPPPQESPIHVVVLEPAAA